MRDTLFGLSLVLLLLTSCSAPRSLAVVDDTPPSPARSGEPGPDAEGSAALDTAVTRPVVDGACRDWQAEALVESGEFLLGGIADMVSAADLAFAPSGLPNVAYAIVAQHGGSVWHAAQRADGRWLHRKVDQVADVRNIALIDPHNEVPFLAYIERAGKQLVLHQRRGVPETLRSVALPEHASCPCQLRYHETLALHALYHDQSPSSNTELMHLEVAPDGDRVQHATVWGYDSPNVSSLVALAVDRQSTAHVLHIRPGPEGGLATYAGESDLGWHSRVIGELGFGVERQALAISDDGAVHVLLNRSDEPTRYAFGQDGKWQHKSLENGAWGFPTIAVAGELVALLTTETGPSPRFPDGGQTRAHPTLRWRVAGGPWQELVFAFKVGFKIGDALRPVMRFDAAGKLHILLPTLLQGLVYLRSSCPLAEMSGAPTAP